MDALSVVQYCCLSDKINYYRLIDYRCAKYPRQSTYILINIPSPRFPSILRTTHGRNDPKCGMLMYPGHPRTDLILASTGPISTLWWPKNLVKLGFLSILRGTHGRIGLKCGMLMYPDQFHKWFLARIGPISALWWPKNLMKLGFPGNNVNAWKAWPEMWHACVSWPPPEIIRFYSVLVPLVAKKLSELGFLVIHYKENTWKEWPEIWHENDVIIAWRMFLSFYSDTGTTVHIFKTFWNGFSFKNIFFILIQLNFNTTVEVWE